MEGEQRGLKKELETVRKKLLGLQTELEERSRKVRSERIGQLYQYGAGHPKEKLGRGLKGGSNFRPNFSFLSDSLYISLELFTNDVS